MRRKRHGRNNQSDLLAKLLLFNVCDFDSFIIIAVSQGGQ
jgi:hypothetical protein